MCGWDLGLNTSTGPSLAPGEAKPVTITYKVSSTDQPGLTSRKVLLFTDDAKQPRISLTLSAVVD